MAEWGEWECGSTPSSIVVYYCRLFTGIVYCCYLLLFIVCCCCCLFIVYCCYLLLFIVCCCLLFVVVVVVCCCCLLFIITAINYVVAKERKRRKTVEKKLAHLEKTAQQTVRHYDSCFIKLAKEVCIPLNCPFPLPPNLNSNPGFFLVLRKFRRNLGWKAWVEVASPLSQYTHTHTHTHP